MDEKKRKKNQILSWAIRGLLALLALYVGMQLLAVMNRGYKTETAIQYSMTDSITMDGFLDFDQITVEGDGLLGYLVKSGERVSAGTALAEKYDSIEQAQCREQLQKVEDQIALLEKSQSNAADVDILLNQMQSNLIQVLEDLDRKDYSGLEESGGEYLLSANKFQYTTGKVRDFSQPLSQLQSAKQELESQLGSPEAIYASTSGYFVDAPHALTLDLDRESLQNTTPAQMKEYLSQDHTSPLSGAAGKIVTSYQWYFYGVCTLEESGKFSDTEEVTLSFPGWAEQKLPAQVVEVIPDEEAGVAKVVLSCEYMNAEIPALAQQSAQVDFASYEGIRIPAEALHIVDGNKGVYVKYGNIVYFRKIQILYQDEDFILVPEGGKVGSDNEVRLYDEIITEGSGLKDEKLL